MRFFSLIGCLWKWKFKYCGRYQTDEKVHGWPPGLLSFRWSLTKPVGLLSIKHPLLCLPADVSSSAFHKARIRVSLVTLLDYAHVLLKLKPNELPRWYYRHLFVGSRTLNFAYLFFPYPLVLASLIYTGVPFTPFNETKDKSSMFIQHQIQPLPCALCHGQTMRGPLLRFTPLHGA